MNDAGGTWVSKISSDQNRFVAFAFASANIMVESGLDGTIGYATGAFRSEFGQAADQFVGRQVQELVAPADHEALADGLLLLRECGRLLPMTIRLSNTQRTPLALSGLMLPVDGRPPTLNLTFALLPSSRGRSVTTNQSFSRAAEARLRTGKLSELKLLEMRGAKGISSDAFGAALQAVAPGKLLGEIAPGRFGILNENSATDDGPVKIASMLETALQAQGIAVEVASNELTLSMNGLSPNQAVRALRHALTVFARTGGPGLNEAGFAQGLTGYLKAASVHTGALRRAIRAGRFDIAYQPIVALVDGQVHHYEALIRPHPIPECQLEGPQDFIQLVEALGLVSEVDLIIAQKACDAAKATGTSVAFNMSGQSAQDPGFRKELLKLLKPHEAVRTGRMAIELTETADIEDLDETARTASALREIGIVFCIDDFGAGTADVQLLRKLGADIVKLDGSYVPGVTQSGRERAFIAGMIGIARGAGAEVIAERVETKAEAEALRALGAKYGQGWYFGRPGPLPAIPASRGVGSSPRTWSRN